MTEPQQSLGVILRQRRSDSLLVDAEIIRDFPDGEQRTRYAEMLIREAMVQHALGNISRDVEYQLFSMLAFSMPTPDGVPPKS